MLEQLSKPKTYQIQTTDNCRHSIRDSRLLKFKQGMSSMFMFQCAINAPWVFPQVSVHHVYGCGNQRKSGSFPTRGNTKPSRCRDSTSSWLRCAPLAAQGLWRKARSSNRNRWANIRQVHVRLLIHVRCCHTLVNGFDLTHQRTLLSHFIVKHAHSFSYVSSHGYLPVHIWMAGT